MQRHHIEPRQGWEDIIDSQGLSFNLEGGTPYWDESVYYSFNAAEIDLLEKATLDLNQMCLTAVQHVIEHNLFAQFRIPPEFIGFVKHSWENDEHTIYGRFDLAFDGTVLKLLEYNADTPTVLIEAAVIQWFWLQQVWNPNQDPNSPYDQFNSIHERLIEAWRAVKPQIQGTLYFAAIDESHEDFMTVNYLRDTAVQAELETRFIPIDAIGWNARRQQFVDEQARPIDSCFKLYPWEWLTREKFAPYLLRNTVRWFEPPWKMLLSNKAILAVLYSLFPDSPYLLPAGWSPFGDSYIEKPILAREGANTRLVVNGELVQQMPGPYSSGPFIYQQYTPLPNFDGHFPVVGSWMVNGYACGIGIREDTAHITSNISRFVPHCFHQ